MYIPFLSGNGSDKNKVNMATTNGQECYLMDTAGGMKTRTDEKQKKILHKLQSNSRTSQQQPDRARTKFAWVIVDPEIITIVKVNNKQQTHMRVQIVQKCVKEHRSSALFRQYIMRVSRVRQCVYIRSTFSTHEYTKQTRRKNKHKSISNIDKFHVFTHTVDGEWK